MTDTSPTSIFSTVEPAVSDMLADPVVHLVMKRDGVSREDILRLLHSAAADRDTDGADADAASANGMPSL
jgi:hypothetical protein